MKFVLEIELGNEAMQTPGDVAATLRDIARQLSLPSVWNEYDRVLHTIRDENGNRVGRWSVTE